MLKIVELKREANEGKVQNLHENCKDREKQYEDELQVLEIGKRAVEWIPELHCEVSGAFESIGSNGVYGVP